VDADEHHDGVDRAARLARPVAEEVGEGQRGYPVDGAVGGADLVVVARRGEVGAQQPRGSLRREDESI